MITDKDGFKWGERNDSIKHVVLYTSRQIMVFTPCGHQIPFYQRAVNSYRVNKKLAQEIADKAEKFTIAKWKGSNFSITKKEFEYLLGLRTKKMDLSEIAK